MILADRCSFIHIGHAWRYIAHIFIRISNIFFPRSIYTLIEIEYRYEVQKSQKKGQYTSRWSSHWLSGYILTLRLVTMVQVHCISFLRLFFLFQIPYGFSSFYLNKIKVDSKMTHLRMSKKWQKNRFTSTRSLRNNLFCQCSFLPSRWTNNKYERFLLMWHFFFMFSFFFFLCSISFGCRFFSPLSMPSELMSNVLFCVQRMNRLNGDIAIYYCVLSFLLFPAECLSALATMQDRARKHWWQSQKL